MPIISCTLCALCSSYGLIYGLEHRLETPLDECIYGYSRDELGDMGEWRFKCAEGRLNMCYESIDESMSKKPLIRIMWFPTHLFMKAFITVHKDWVRWCPIYKLMTIIAPQEFAQKEWHSYKDPHVKYRGLLGIIRDI